MLILGVDTSGKNGSIALVRFVEEQAHTLDVVALEGGTFSAQLVPQISALLAKHNLTKNDIDGFAVASGPGSFTGLRVGLAAIKALAEVLLRPIAAVSLLETVAFAAGKAPLNLKSRCTVAIEAGRGEIFVGEYVIGGRTPQTLSESLFALDDLIQLAEKLGKSEPIVTPDELLLERVKARMRDPFLCNIVLVAKPDAAFITRLGWKKILAGNTVSPETLDATYIRRCDAEIMRSRKSPE